MRQFGDPIETDTWPIKFTKELAGADRSVGHPG